jgi:tetrahydromethanopterin S-methyltransferase subunit A
VYSRSTANDTRVSHNGGFTYDRATWNAEAAAPVKLLDDVATFVRRTLAPRPDRWPFVRGDYTVIDAGARTVVATVNGGTLAKDLIAAPPPGLCMVARLRSANDAANLLLAIHTNLAVQTLICAGESDADEPFAPALLKLGRGDEVAAGPTGSLMNTIAARLEAADLAAVRKRVRFVDLLGPVDVKRVAAQVRAGESGGQDANAAFITHTDDSGVDRLVVPRDVRHEVREDKTGHFAIRVEERSIVLEHKNAKDELLRIIEGKTARDLCLTLIRNGWVSKLEHAAYLGRELARAELALRNGHAYRQDTIEPIADRPPPATTR